MQKPVMTKEVEQEVLNASVQFIYRDKWRLWGMHLLREQGPCILLEGPPGCGKTVIAKWLASKVKRGFKELSVASVGGGEPGATEKGIEDFFDESANHKSRTVFIDECDHILRNRADVTGEGLTWMVGTTDSLLRRISTYKGLVILASNFAQVLDSALDRRLMARIHIPRPEKPQRIMLWKMKWPDRFPFQPSNDQIDNLSDYDLSGAQIETVIIKVASDAIRKKVKPIYKMFEHFAYAVEKSRLEEQQKLQ